MNIRIEPLSDKIGAAIYGLDLRQTLSSDEKVAVTRAFADHLAVCIRGQELTLDEFLAAANQFGKSKPHLYRKLRHKDYPHLSVVSSEDRKLFGEKTKNPRATHFHTDESYLAKPSKATMLYSMINPKSGGETKFVNMYRAYETLPESTKTMLEGLKAVHRFGTNRPGVALLKLSDEEKAETPDVVHPIVRTHPDTGRKALFVNAARTDSVVGMDADEGKALLEDLYTHSIKPEFQYHHDWAVGDVMMWDNRCTMHAATNTYGPDEKRLLYRVLLEGDAPR